jgi:SAM-dependent methyltransferase
LLIGFDLADRIMLNWARNIESAAMLIDAVKHATPWPIRLASRKVKRVILQRREARMSCQDVFTKIYRSNEWGGTGEDFYSGPGSSAEAAKPYTDAVRRFIAEKGIRSVVDAGCGDFRVGQVIADTGVRYIGVDIVEPLIARNQRLFGGPQISFLVGNLAEDDLPDAELCLVREVFQHLSNCEIQCALARLRKFRYLIVTDHQPAPGRKFAPNRDKPHGRDIRLYDGSALMLDKPPFNVRSIQTFLDVPSPNILIHPNERLRSFLICHRHQPTGSA